MSSKHIAGAVALLLAGSVSAQADTGSSHASTTFRISGYVPVLCHVEVASGGGTPQDDGIVDLGRAEEFCNAPRGYRVLVNHPAGLDGAAMIVGGSRVPLSSTGETVLTDSSQPDIRSVALAVDLGDEPDRFRSLSVRIEAKG